MDRAALSIVHRLRMEEHWGKRWAEENAFAPNRWPADDKSWRAVEHNAHPADTNVEMAKFHLSLSRKIVAALDAPTTPQGNPHE